jgi:hypothetical protein
MSKFILVSLIQRSNRLKMNKATVLQHDGLLVKKQANTL